MLKYGWKAKTKPWNRLGFVVYHVMLSQLTFWASFSRLLDTEYKDFYHCFTFKFGTNWQHQQHGILKGNNFRFNSDNTCILTQSLPNWLHANTKVASSLGAITREYQETWLSTTACTLLAMCLLIWTSSVNWSAHALGSIIYGYLVDWNDATAIRLNYKNKTVWYCLSKL